MKLTDATLVTKTSPRLTFQMSSPKMPIQLNEKQNKTILNKQKRKKPCPVIKKEGENKTQDK